MGTFGLTGCNENATEPDPLTVSKAGRMAEPDCPMRRKSAPTSTMRLSIAESRPSPRINVTNKPSSGCSSKHERRQPNPMNKREGVLPDADDGERYH